MHYTRGMCISGTDIKGVARRCWDRMQEDNLTLHQIVVRGISGLTVGSCLACKGDNNMLVIRKSVGNSHSSNPVEGQDDGSPYLLVDDFVSSGSTIDAMITTLGCEPEKVTVMLYDQMEAPTWDSELRMAQQGIEDDPLDLGNKARMERVLRLRRVGTWIANGHNW